ncbi:hypothetical protein [Mucilaginibacter agri]|uniref:Lipoprotein n=1 Tax=Mucilaginibacter agri TaxID=2695265 RepID=A0A966DQZ7_9SPHI|nr:hypothetical protein [Mucilaginibacter agri]NCD67960.1 hypothetical protein [Mucilaginibacter agri]
MKKFLTQASVKFSAYAYQLKKMRVLAILAIAPVLMAGCKKTQATSEEDPASYYGYGKLTVDCESKCHVSFGTPGKMNEFDVQATKATYYFRYQTKYDIDINITPLDVTQTMTLNVFSREEKQIFNNTVRKNVGEVWNSTILVP